jgi:outer membrane protein TolC
MRLLIFFLLLSFCQLTFAAAAPITLSLKEAILLAVRQNPNVESSELTKILTKFNVFIQRWQFYPHYDLSLSLTAATGRSSNRNLPITHGLDAKPEISWTSPIGTQVMVSASNTKTLYYNPGASLTIVQPLIRGFGEPIVETALENAKDSDVIARLTTEGVVRDTISKVIEAYLDLLSAQGIVHIDEEALKRAKVAVQQTKLFIEAGHKAGNELISVEADLANAKNNLANDLNTLTQARYALLEAIGMDPTITVHFEDLDLNTLLTRYHPLSLQATQQLILKNDIQYQTDLITLHGQTQRDVLTAEDNTRWQLNASATLATGYGSGGGYNSGLNSLYNGTNRAESVGLELTIPIDDQLSKQALLNAKIALKQAEIGLKQEKWSKESNAITTWNALGSAKESVTLAREAAALEEKTYQLNYQRYLHGLIDSLELQATEVRLIQDQQSLLASEISYLKLLVNLDELVGHTLITWGVHVRLS